jgi:hypothetical protein
MATRRETLGDFSSIVCFRALVVGIEDVLGADGAVPVLVRAGRIRGKQVATDLGAAGSKLTGQELVDALNKAVGAEGTRLCQIDAVEQHGDKLIVKLSETICSSEELEGSSRKLTFTMGAITGAIETVMDQKYKPVNTESVLRGGSHDVIELTPAAF